MKSFLHNPIRRDFENIESKCNYVCEVNKGSPLAADIQNRNDVLI